MKIIGPLHSQPFVRRHPANPVLTAEQVPFPTKLAYNGGVMKFRDRYVMTFRSDSGWDPEKKKAPIFRIGLAYSEDGLHWRVEPEPILRSDDPDVMGEIDPRVNILEGRAYVTFCQWANHGYRATIAATDDFRTFDIIHRSEPDNRDIVLFPEKINGKYYRLDRPFPIDSRDQKIRFDIWINESPDLVYWGESQPLLCVEDVPYATERLGAGSPPIRTEAGWLVLFHAVDVDPSRGKNGWEDEWNSRYTAGAVLLDLENPRQVIAVSHDPLLVPETRYEISEGFRHNVIFPMALVPEPDGTVKIYYSAADTVECLATCSLDELVGFCLSYRGRTPSPS
jgi:beta-1,4-mannooligosaccharide/beta-1,4-mannosyl-N-acetylglucosamine phosphorylase